MKKIIKSNFLYPIILFLAFAAFTITVKRFDVAPIGPNESQVGFSTINQFFQIIFPWNELPYNISNVLGIVTIAVAAFFFIFTIVDIIKKKSIKKADAGLIVLMFYFALIVALYILFDKVVVINYRPVILNVVLKPSYPSTHTFMAISVLLAAKLQFALKIKDDFNSWLVTSLCNVCLIVLIACRLISGVHWFSDIIGGILLGSALYSLYFAIVLKIYKSDAVR